MQGAQARLRRPDETFRHQRGAPLVAAERSPSSETALGGFRTANIGPDGAADAIDNRKRKAEAEAHSVAEPAGVFPRRTGARRRM